MQFSYHRHLLVQDCLHLGLERHIVHPKLLLQMHTACLLRHWLSAQQCCEIQICQELIAQTLAEQATLDFLDVPWQVEKKRLTASTDISGLIGR